MKVTLVWAPFCEAYWQFEPHGCWPYAGGHLVSEGAPNGCPSTFWICAGVSIEHPLAGGAAYAACELQSAKSKMAPKNAVTADFQFISSPSSNLVLVSWRPFNRQPYNTSQLRQNILRERFFLRFDLVRRKGGAAALHPDTERNRSLLDAELH